MEKYHKIESMFMRDPATNNKTFLPEYSRPEFAYLENCEWEWTEKVDGTNVRVIWDGEAVRFKGKTDDAQMPLVLLQHLQETFSPEKFRVATPECTSVCLYGEGYGPKIQSGERYRKDVGFILFDVRIGGFWLRRTDVADIAAQFGIPVCPIVGRGTLPQAVEFTKTRYKSNVAADAGLMAEGIVLRPAVEMLDREGRRIITKLKAKDFPNA